MRHYLMYISYGIHKEIVGVFSTIEKANEYLGNRFGYHRTYYATFKSNGIELGYSIEAKLNQAYYYINLMKIELNKPIKAD